MKWALYFILMESVNVCYMKINIACAIFQRTIMGRFFLKDINQITSRVHVCFELHNIEKNQCIIYIYIYIYMRNWTLTNYVSTLCFLQSTHCKIPLQWLCDRPIKWRIQHTWPWCNDSGWNTVLVNNSWWIHAKRTW